MFTVWFCDWEQDSSKGYKKKKKIYKGGIQLQILDISIPVPKCTWLNMSEVLKLWVKSRDTWEAFSIQTIYREQSDVSQNTQEVAPILTDSQKPGGYARTPHRALDTHLWATEWLQQFGYPGLLFSWRKILTPKSYPVLSLQNRSIKRQQLSNIKGHSSPKYNKSSLFPMQLTDDQCSSLLIIARYCV